MINSTSGNCQSMSLFSSYRLPALIGMALVLAGCGGTLSGAGPYKSDIVEERPDYTVIDINAGTIRPFMSPAQRPMSPSVTSFQTNEVRLTSGDVISILITDNAQEGSGLFAPLSKGGTQLKVRVDSRGKISLPYVGNPVVMGMTLVQVEELIRQKLKGVTTDVQAHVDLVGDLSGSVLVAGAVKTPGRFSTLDGPLTLLDAVNQAGGPVMEPHLAKVTVRTGSAVTSMNYEEILAGGNFVLQPNSEIVVEKARQRFVAMGAVAEPGLHDLPAQNTSLLDALGSVGGLKETSANPQGVFIFRMAPPEAPQGTKPQVLRIDMRDPAAMFFARQIMLKPDDTLYVTNSAVYEWQKVITPIVQTLLLQRTVNGL